MAKFKRSEKRRKKLGAKIAKRRKLRLRRETLVSQDPQVSEGASSETDHDREGQDQDPPKES